MRCGHPIWASKLPRALAMAASTLAIALLFSLCVTCVGAAVDTVYHSHNSVFFCSCFWGCLRAELATAGFVDDALELQSVFLSWLTLGFAFR